MRNSTLILLISSTENDKDLPAIPLHLNLTAAPRTHITVISILRILSSRPAGNVCWLALLLPAS